MHTPVKVVLVQQKKPALSSFLGQNRWHTNVVHVQSYKYASKSDYESFQI